MQLTKEQAFQNIKQVVEAFKGTKQDHIALQQSMDIIELALKEPEAKKGDDNSTKQ